MDQIFVVGRPLRYAFLFARATKKEIDRANAMVKKWISW